MVRDDATGEEEPITAEEAEAIVEEFREVVQFIIDWESGLFTMSKRDYETMPAPMVSARRIYNKVKNTPHGD